MSTDKAPDAFRTISEAAEDLDLPQHVLRFWETRFPQIKPLKRGGGRRYYRPDDLEFLRGLKHLLHAERYTIKGVQKIIKEQGVKAVQRAGREGPPAPVVQAPVVQAPVVLAPGVSPTVVHPPVVRSPAHAADARPASEAPAREVRAARPDLRPALQAAMAELLSCRETLAAALR